MTRPIWTKGGPSPRIRAFASQEVLSFRRWAASFGVSRTVMAVAGFSDGMPFWTVNFEVILWISRSRRTPNYLATAPMRRDIALFIDVGWGDDWQRVEPRLGIFLSNNTALA